MVEHMGSIAVIAGLALAACGVGVAAEEAEVPDGTVVRVRLNQTIHSEQHDTGSAFVASVTEPVYGFDGRTLIPAGSVVQGEVVEFQENPPRLEVEFTEIEVRGESRRVEAAPLEFEGATSQESVAEGVSDVSLLSRESHVFIPAGSILQLELLRPLPVSLEAEDGISNSDRHAASAD